MAFLEQFPRLDVRALMTVKKRRKGKADPEFRNVRRTGKLEVLVSATLQLDAIMIRLLTSGRWWFNMGNGHV